MPVADNQLDFKGLAAELLGRSRELVPQWLEGGKINGREYKTSGLQGGSGDSMSINLDTGLWADFADSSCSGGDLISLYAKIHNIGQAEAFRILSGEQGFEPAERPEIPPEPEPEPETCLPPENVDEPNFIHPNHGEAIAHWTYRTEDGHPIFHVARYEPDGKKAILPWSWSDEVGWCLKGFPPPRPLFGLEELARLPNAPVLVVEGEKCAVAARYLVEDRYVVVSWPNGSNAVNKADWRPLAGRVILLWPDNDEAGKKAMYQIAEILKKQCPVIKILEV
jgi:hypothetical protein